MAHGGLGDRFFDGSTWGDHQAGDNSEPGSALAKINSRLTTRLIDRNSSLR
jgi:hypothetical protein